MDYEKIPMMLTPKDVAEILNLPQGQVYRLFNSKAFPSIKINNKHVIPKPRFLTWLGIEED